MVSTMRSLGDTVCKFGVCVAAGSLIGSKWVPKPRGSSKRVSLDSDMETKSLLLKSNMVSGWTSGRVTVSSGSGLEEPPEEVPSKSWERGMVEIFC